MTSSLGAGAAPGRLRARLRSRLRTNLPAGGRERGSMSVFVVLFALTAFLLGGFVIDTGMAISKRERAADIAEQAARRVADDIDLDTLRETGRAVVRGADCGAKAQEIVSATGEGVVTRCTVDPDNTVHVGIQIQYDSAMLGLIGFHRFTANAKADAHPVTGINNAGDN